MVNNNSNIGNGRAQYMNNQHKTKNNYFAKTSQSRLNYSSLV